MPPRPTNASMDSSAMPCSSSHDIIWLSLNSLWSRILLNFASSLFSYLSVFEATSFVLSNTATFVDVEPGFMLKILYTDFFSDIMDNSFHLSFKTHYTLMAKHFCAENVNISYVWNVNKRLTEARDTNFLQTALKKNTIRKEVLYGKLF